jgi:hypothetical protein
MKTDDVTRGVTTGDPQASRTAGKGGRAHDASPPELWTALRELVTLQAHYAKLLNMHDGGERHAFASAEEWIERLRYLASRP